MFWQPVLRAPELHHRAFGWCGSGRGNFTDEQGKIIMRILHDETTGGATNASGKLAVRRVIPITTKSADGKSAVDDQDWFSEAARRLYTQKPGTVLHTITSLGDERLCQRYASGEVRPPAYFLRALQRSDHGRQWSAIVLDGVAWWIELNRSADIGRKVLDLTREGG